MKTKHQGKPRSSFHNLCPVFEQREYDFLVFTRFNKLYLTVFNMPLALRCRSSRVDRNKSRVGMTFTSVDYFMTGNLQIVSFDKLSDEEPQEMTSFFSFSGLWRFK